MSVSISTRRGAFRLYQATLAAAAGLQLLGAIHAQTIYTWNGGGTDDNWGTGTNWVGGNAPTPATNNDLVFVGSTRLTPNANYTAFDDFRNIFFASGASSFTVSGNAIDLFGKIENNSSSAQTFNLALGTGTLSSSFIEINPVDGDLNIGGANVFLGNNQLRVYGNNAKTLTFGTTTIISGTGATFALNQNSNVIFQSAHTYTGDTFINAGTLQFSTGASATSTIRIGDTSGTTASNLNFATTGQTYSNAIEFRAGSSGTRTLYSSGTTTLSGVVTLSATPTFNTTAGTLTVSNNIPATAIGIIKTGSGTLALTGTNAYTGGTTINGGTVNFTSSGLGASGAIAFGASGTALQWATANTTDVSARFAAFGANSPVFDTNGNNVSFANATSLSGTGGFTKAGAGQLSFTTANAGLSGNVSVTGGTLAVGTGGNGTSQPGSIGSGQVFLSNGTAFRMNTNSSGSIFPSNAIQVAAGATVFMSAGSAACGYGGTVSSADSSGVFTIGGTTQVSLSANAKQFGSGFNGTVEIPGGASLRFSSSTGGFTNGGDTATFNVLGALTTRNGGNVNVGALSGTSSTATVGLGVVTGSTSGTYIIGAKNIDTSFAGIIQNGDATRLVAVTKTGTGAQTLTGASTYTGATLVQNGKLKVNGSLAVTTTTVGNTTAASLSPTLTGGVITGSTQNPNSATLANYVPSNTVGFIGGMVTISGQANATSSAGHLAPGDGGVGTMRFGSLTLATGASSNSFLDFEFNGTANDFVDVVSSAGFTISGARVNLFQEGTSTAFSANGTYNLFSYAGALGGSASNLTVNNTVAGKTYGFSLASGFVQLTIDDALNPIYWNRNVGNTWTTGTNWLNSDIANTAPNGQRRIAAFGGGVGATQLTSDAIVSLDGSKTVGQMLFNNSSFIFTIAQGSGGTLTLDNRNVAAIVTDTAGNHTISAPVLLTTGGAAITVTNAADTLTISGDISGSSDGISKSGSGKLLLSGSNTYGGPTSINGGTLTLASGNDRIPTGATLSIASGANLDLGGQNQTVASLNGAGSITNNGSADSTLTVNGAGALSGVISNGGTNKTALVKTGSGTLVLSGANTYTGGTVVSGGGITFTNAQQTAPGSSAMEISGGGSITLNAASGSNNSYNLGTLAFTGSGGSLTSNLIVNSTQIFSVGTLSTTATATGTMTHNGRTSLNGGGGSGTLTIIAPATVAGNSSRYLMNNDWSAYAGTINFVGSAVESTVSLAQNGGSFTNLAGAYVNLSSTSGTNKMYLQGRFNTGSTIQIGALQGTADSSLRPDNGFGGGKFQIGDRGDSTTFAGTITDNGVSASLIKSGGGSLTLSGVNTYSGTTAVTAGKLIVNAAHNGGDNYTVGGGPLGATLGGSGPINLASGKTLTLASNGTIAPGNSAGTLSISGNVTITGGIASTSEFEFIGTNVTPASPSNPGVDFDLLAITGSLSLGGSRLNVVVPGGTDSVVYHVPYQIVTATGGITGAFAKLNDQVTTLQYRNSYPQYDVTINANSIEITFVPEPGSLSAIAIASGLLLRRRRRA